jgi:hypothetical protein
MLQLRSSLLIVCAVVVGVARAAENPPAPESPATPVAVASARPAATRGHRLVYSCRDGNVPMFADRPCGEASLLRSLDVYTPAQSGRPPTTVAEPAKATTRPAVRETRVKAAQEPADKCEYLQKRLDDVDDRMRAGYPARQAAQLWQRWRDARDAVREAGC